MRKLHPKSINLLLSLFSGMVGKVTFTMSAIYRVDMVGLDVLQLVLLGTALEASVFLFEIPTGVVADVYSRRLSVIIGTGLIGMGFILEGVLPLFITVLLAQVVWGLGWTFISGARSAWLTDEVGVDNAGDLFMQGRQALLIGNLVGIGLAVPLAKLSLQLPYFIGGGLNLLLVVILILFMPETGFKRKPREEREGWGDLAATLRSGFGLIRSRSTLMWFSAAALLVGLYSEGWDRLKEPLLLTDHTFPGVFGISLGAVEWFAILAVVGSLLAIAASQVVRKRLDLTNPARLGRGLQISYAVMVACMLGFALAGKFWTAISFMMLFDLIRSVSFPISAAFVNHFIESDVRATVLSMTGQIDAFGQMAGGPIIGTIGRLVSMPAAILASAAVLFPTVPLFQLMLRRKNT